jgi:hypothetical protein
MEDCIPRIFFGNAVSGAAFDVVGAEKGQVHRVRVYSTIHVLPRLSGARMLPVSLNPASHYQQLDS